MTPIRLAIWSGPRNLSTAMMRSFGARADCAVSDEPFYANYLATSGAVHPMQDEIIAGHENDPDKVIAHLTKNPALVTRNPQNQIGNKHKNRLVVIRKAPCTQIR